MVNYTFENVVDDHTIDAIFKAEFHTTTVTAHPGGSVVPSGEVQVPPGRSQVFMVTPGLAIPYWMSWWTEDCC